MLTTRLAALLCAYAVATCGMAQGQDLTTFRDPDGRFTLRHPADWTSVSSTADPTQHLFAVSSHPIGAVSDEIKHGLSLLIVANPAPGVITEANCLSAAVQIRDEAGRAIEADGTRVTWGEMVAGPWGGVPAGRCRAQTARGNERSEGELLVAFGTRWIVIGTCVWPAGEMDAALAAVRDSFRMTEAETTTAGAGQAATGGIVFVRQNPGEHSGSELWLCRPGGGEPVQLSHLNAAGGSPVSVEHPAWSPDGSVIAFSSDLNSGRSAYPWNIFTLSADGGTLRQLTFSPLDYRVDPAAAGCTIAGRVLHPASPTPLGLAGVRVSAGGTAATTLTDAQGRFRLQGVAAGENWIKLWAPERDSATWGFDGENPSSLLWRRLTPNTEIDLGDIPLSNAPGSFLSRVRLTEPTWTADGARIVFVRSSELRGKSGDPHLMVINDPEWVASYGHTKLEEIRPFQPLSEFRGGVAYVFRRAQLMSMDALGGHMAALTGPFLGENASPVTIAPDGIAFKAWPFSADHAGYSGPFAFQGDANIVVANLKAGLENERLLPLLAERHSGLAVSPDGRSLAYVKRTAAANPEFGSNYGPLVVVDTQTARERVIADLGDRQGVISGMDFSPDGTGIVLCVTTSGQTQDSLYDMKRPVGDLYIADLSSGQIMALTGDGRSTMPTWGGK